MSPAPKISAKKKMKVKDLAEKYKLAPKEVLKRLSAEGIELTAATDTIPPDMLDLVEDLFTTQKKAEDDRIAAAEQAAAEAVELRDVHIKSPIVVKALSDTIGKKPNEVIQALIKLNVLAGINQTIDNDVAQKVSAKFGVNLLVDKREKSGSRVNEPSSSDLPDEPEEDPAKLKPRPPVVTFLGHVDHGKTSLQDRARKTQIVSGEAGGITQHIGASTVIYNGNPITFIDTPGHEAFTAMRARGASATDIAILVVAADDGFMPQTVEALSHIKAAGVPIIVAANKMDLPQVDVEKILRQMQENDLFPEDWGGGIGLIRVSAHTGMGMDDLLERILLEAEMLELKANPARHASGVVLESQLEQGLGPTASVLVQNGTLKVGDAVLCGEFWGRVRGLTDDKGKRVKSAGPSMPVQVIGLSGAPEAGQKFRVLSNEKEARELAEKRGMEKRNDNLSRSRGTSLEDLFSQMDTEKKNLLRVIIKSDVRGSGEAIVDALAKLPSEKIAVDVVHLGVGGISEGDVLLAAASNAIVVGFHVRVNSGVNALAKREGVEIRLYSIIYQLIEEIKDAMLGRLEPEKRENQVGTGHILKVFEMTKGAPVCGSFVDSGYVRVGTKVRVTRQKELIFNGEVRSLRRFQDDVKEVKGGLECGIRLDNFKDLEEGDSLQFYEVKSEKATLE